MMVEVQLTFCNLSHFYGREAGVLRRGALGRVEVGMAEERRAVMIWSGDQAG